MSSSEKVVAEKGNALMQISKIGARGFEYEVACDENGF
jgi:hypothetical protein